VVQISTLIALFAGIYIASAAFTEVANFLKTIFDFVDFTYLLAISFIFLFLIVIVLVQALSTALERGLHKIALSTVNKFLGSFFSVIKVAFIVGVVFYIFDKVNNNVGYVSEETTNNSLFYDAAVEFVPALIPLLKFPKEFAEATP